MSRQGEGRDQQKEDAWWRQLYGDPYPREAADPGGSLDEHVASALTALRGVPPAEPPPAARGGAAIPVPRRAPAAEARPLAPAAAADPSAWPVADPLALDALVPDTVLDGLGHGPLTVRAASSRGTAARREGRPRGDTMFTARFGRGTGELLLLAVASGGPAARAACRDLATAVGRNRDRLAADLRAGRRDCLKSGLRRLTDRACGQLHAAGDGTGGRSVRCLLLTGDPGCRTRVFFGVGPGGLFRLRRGCWQDLDPAFAGTASARQVFRFHAGAAQQHDTLLLCTGELAAALRGEPEFAGRLADRWGPGRPPPGPAEFLTDTTAPAAGRGGDRSAVAVWDR